MADFFVEMTVSFQGSGYLGDLFLKDWFEGICSRIQSLTLINLIKGSLKLFIYYQTPLQRRQLQTEVKEFRSIKPFSSALLQDTFEFQGFAIPNFNELLFNLLSATW